MRISDWSSDVCSSDLAAGERALALLQGDDGPAQVRHDFPERDHFRVDALAGARLIAPIEGFARRDAAGLQLRVGIAPAGGAEPSDVAHRDAPVSELPVQNRSAEHTSALQSLMRNTSAVFSLKQ